MATSAELAEQLKQTLGIRRTLVQADGAVDTTFDSVEDRLKVIGIFKDDVANDAGTPRRRFVHLSTGKPPF